MLVPEVVGIPHSPPAAPCALLSWLIGCGWPANAGDPAPVARWLEGQDVCSERDFIGLGRIEDMAGADLLCPVASAFLQSLVQARSCTYYW